MYLHVSGIDYVYFSDFSIGFYNCYDSIEFLFSILYLHFMHISFIRT